MYKVNLHHRNGNKNKSQWTIAIPEEVNCFNLAKTNGWILIEQGWGLHFEDGKPEWLGITKDHTNRVFLAKFVGNISHSEWHGYPADYRNNHQDIPDEEVLQKWLTNGTLPPAKIRKIAKGQPCNL